MQHRTVTYVWWSIFVLMMVFSLSQVEIVRATPAQRVDICHIPPDNPANFHTITISENAIASHESHGDKVTDACGVFAEELCNDDDACTIDAFEPGTESCIPVVDRAPADCDDGDPHTADSCDSVLGCINEPICVEPPGGLVAWWPGDGNANDIVGSNHGVLEGGATFASGLVDQAFSLEGSGDIVDLGDNNNIIGTGSTPFTFAAWIFLTSPPPSGDYYFLVRLRQDAQFFVGFTNNSFLPGTYVSAVFRGQNSQWHWPINYSSLLNQWTHFAVTYNGGAKNAASSFTIFFNGIPLSSTGIVNFGTVGGSCNDNALGSDSTPTCAHGNSRFYQGRIDEAQIFNRVLSASEVQTIVNAGSTGLCK